jgi:hypothetical protein
MPIYFQVKALVWTPGQSTDVVPDLDKTVRVLLSVSKKRDEDLLLGQAAREVMFYVLD